MNRRQALTAGASFAMAMVPSRSAGAGSVTQVTTGRSSVVGAWRLLSIATVRPNGEEVTDWAGPKPSGILIYAADGYMSVQVVRDPPARWSYSAPEQAPVAERARAFDRYYGYFGRFAVDLARGVVTHFVDGSLQPNEVGLTYERQLRLEGDRLLLTATPFTFNGEQRFNRLVWQRVAPPA
jgi:lipocalin-like protein